MIKQRITCGTCFGCGTHQKCRAENGRLILMSEEVTCTDCNGQGYKDYAIFTLEEAQAILKHCGLATEGDEVSE